ncbi:HNH endonuclease [Vibrio phage 11895-B1]|uniref:HNH endonuclease n=1 Tax=Vibrio phage 11895-B1 TaxID=754075 RepID=UPI0002C05C11|nr:HNH endonuclease [Vibrio phage 11895-B1]AGH32226.1 hypothetical protein VPHG_00163 [Vibrio phage 11895-B1]
MIVSKIPECDFKVDKTLGYRYTYNPDHELANKSGKVYEHVYIAVINLNRFLSDNECVHHIDRDRGNNSWSNLLVLTNEEHAKLHQEEDYAHEVYEYTCKMCRCVFQCRRKRVPVFCSQECRSKYDRILDIDKEELRLLVWTYPTTKVAKMLGVSDSAIGKYCKKLGVVKPPRGYWQSLKNKI